MRAIERVEKLRVQLKAISDINELVVGEKQVGGCAVSPRGISGHCVPHKGGLALQKVADEIREVLTSTSKSLQYLSFRAGLEVERVFPTNHRAAVAHPHLPLTAGRG